MTLKPALLMPFVQVEGLSRLLHREKSVFCFREPGRSAGAAGALTSTRFGGVGMSAAFRVKPPRTFPVPVLAPREREFGRMSAAIATP